MLSPTAVLEQSLDDSAKHDECDHEEQQYLHDAIPVVTSRNLE